MLNFLKKKRVSVKREPIPLVAPVFTADEKAHLQSMMQTELWSRVMLWLDYKLLERFLNSNIDISKNEKNSYLLCRHNLAELGKPDVEKESKEDEYGYMQTLVGEVLNEKEYAHMDFQDRG